MHGEAIAYHLLGRRAEADAAFAAFVAKYQSLGSLQVAQLCALRGEAGEAVAWLERAYVTRDTGLSQLKATTYLDRLAHDARYQAFSTRCGCRGSRRLYAGRPTPSTTASSRRRAYASSSSFTTCPIPG